MPFKVVTAFQSLYYLDKNSFEITLFTLYEKIKKGIFVATMMSVLSKQFYDNSIETSVSYLREINFTDSRQEIKDYFILFSLNEEDLMNKFKIFKPVHIGYHSAKFRNNERDGHHYVFTGIKEL